MRSIFLSREQVFDKPLPFFRSVGTAAPASDLALLTAPDDGFLVDSGGGINYFLADGCVDRFGRVSAPLVLRRNPVSDFCRSVVVQSFEAQIPDL